MYSKNFSFVQVRYLVALLCALILLQGCRNKDGEQAFVDAVDIIELGVVSIDIQAGAQGLILESGTQSQFQALATLEDSSSLDVSNRVRWSSADSNVFNVDASGLVSAGANDGVANLSIAWGDFKASNSLTVSTAALNSIAFSNFPSSVSECFDNTQLSVEGNYADRTSNITSLVSTWTSTAESVAKVGATGAVTTFTSGTTDIGASYKGQVATPLTLIVNDSLQSLTLTPSTDFDLEANATRALTVTAIESGQGRNVSHIASYVSSDTNVLSVSDSGVVQAGSAVGSAQVTANCGGLDSNIVTVTIVEPATASSLIIRYNGGSSNPAGPFDTSDSPVQLQAFLRYSNNTEVDVTTSEYIDWTVLATVSGTAATVGNSGNDNGEVRFNAVGRTEIQAVYDDDEDYFESSLDVLVQ